MIDQGRAKHILATKNQDTRSNKDVFIAEMEARAESGDKPDSTTAEKTVAAAKLAKAQAKQRAYDAKQAVLATKQAALDARAAERKNAQVAEQERYKSLSRKEQAAEDLALAAKEATRVHDSKVRLIVAGARNIGLGQFCDDRTPCSESPLQFITCIFSQQCTITLTCITLLPQFNLCYSYPRISIF